MLKGKAFYISLMAGAICVVAIAAVCLDTAGFKNELPNGQINDGIAKLEKTEEKDDAEPEIQIKDNGLLEKSDGIKGNVQANDSKQTAEPSKSDKNEEKIQTEKNKDDNSSKSDKNSKKDKNGKSDKSNKSSAEQKNKESLKNSSKTSEEKVAVMKSGDNVKGMKFNEEKGLKWPVSGEVLMKYSADTPVYFKTLAQYKSNPAIMITAKKGDNVCSCVDGIVSDIGVDDEIGNYVETSIGDNYKILYGQLDNIQVKKGDNIEEGQIIGVVASPSKYFTEEGTNLYMKMTQDGNSVDPMLFLR